MPLEPEVPHYLPQPPRDAPWDWAFAAAVPLENEAAIERLRAVSQWYTQQINEIRFSPSTRDNESRLHQLRVELGACRADLEMLWTAEPVVAVEIEYKWPYPSCSRGMQTPGRSGVGMPLVRSTARA